MYKWLICLLMIISSSTNAAAYNQVNTVAGSLKYREDWGYVDVRPNAHMFWWLYARQPPSEDRPLILWLQGGPGSSSSGFGNFEEFGPKDLNGNDRNATWLQLADLIFVDNPVGAGFSYVDYDSAYTTDVDQIGKDLMVWAIEFFSLHPEYRSRPFFIFCESYGGKMAAEFARVLLDHTNVFPINLKAVALGDSWISGIDFVETWGPYLHVMSFLDENQLEEVKQQTDRCRALIDQNKWFNATDCWGESEDLISRLTSGVSWYNILKPGGSDDWSTSKKKARTLTEKAYLRQFGHYQRDQMEDYMDTVVRSKLGIIPENVKFGAQAGNVFEKQAGDFMKPNYDTVDTLLAKNFNVIVFNGQMDLICDTLGTEKWIKRLKWKHLEEFKKTRKQSYRAGHRGTDGYFKVHRNLQFWYILRAGHMVAYDAPEATMYMIRSVIQQFR